MWKHSVEEGSWRGNGANGETWSQSPRVFVCLSLCVLLHFSWEKWSRFLVCLPAYPSTCPLSYLPTWLSRQPVRQPLCPILSLPVCISAPAPPPPPSSLLWAQRYWGQAGGVTPAGRVEGRGCPVYSALLHLVTGSHNHHYRQGNFTCASQHWGHSTLCLCPPSLSLSVSLSLLCLHFSHLVCLISFPTTSTESILGALLQ